jgi:hypothetical protein
VTADCHAYNCRRDIVLLPSGKKSARFYSHNDDESGVMWQISKPALNLKKRKFTRSEEQANKMVSQVQPLGCSKKRFDGC